MGPFRSSATRRLAALGLVLGTLGACGSDTPADTGSAGTGSTATGSAATGSTVAGSTDTGSAVTDSTVTGSTDTAGPAATDAPSPLAFQNAAVGGGTIDFEALAGRPTALWFWAPY